MPLINRCGGGGGGTPQLCEQVENFTVSVGMLTATLTWTAPTTDEDDSFVGTRIVRKVGSAPQSKNDGTVVYEGTALTYTDTGLTGGTTYYYRAFAYNAKNKYQTAMRVVSLTAKAISDTFSENDWDTIIEACQSGSVPSAWSVGDSKTMTIDGVEHQVDIIGKNHDTYTDGGTAPLTFQPHDLVGTFPSWNTSYDNYISKMPANVQTAIKSIKKTRHDSTENFKLPFFSVTELYGTGISGSGYTEGSQYAYYAAGNSKAKTLNGVANDWWLASWASGGKYFFITNSGTYTSTTSKGSTKGVSFCFCF